MSKRVFKKNEDGSYCHKNTDSYIIYSVNHDKVSSAITKMFGRKGWIIVHSDHDLDYVMANNKFRHGETLAEVKSILDNTLTLRVNMMTKKKYRESVTTPLSCSPSSETYWSM